MSKAEVRVTAREWTFAIESAPHTTATTSALNVVTIAPERMTMTEYASGTVHAQIEGRKIKANGEPGEVYVKGRVLVTQMDGSWQRYEPAPEWVAEVYRGVS